MIRYDDVVIELIAAADIDRNDADGYDLVARARRIAANLGLS